MTLTPVALVLLTAQRHHLEGLPDEQAVSQRWQARALGRLIVQVQWDGEAGAPGETFSRGWVHHPDFRAETGDLPLRAGLRGAGAGGQGLEKQRRGGRRRSAAPSLSRVPV